ncbi:MAG: hypothetical protein RL088_2562 [Verrucomicrobiota bacterium]|jgi:hypothetical protein
MLKHTLPAIVALGALTACETGKTEKSHSASMPAYRGSAEFQRMKSLAGKWTGESPQMGKMNTEFRVIAGDSVIEERFGAGTPMEMVSMYHDVNGKLTMTHYCMLRNQPRMRVVKSTPDSITFDFVATPGLNAAKEMHMHSAKYTFIDANHFKMEGSAWKDGKPTPCGPPVVFTRK